MRFGGCCNALPVDKPVRKLCAKERIGVYAAVLLDRAFFHHFLAIENGRTGFLRARTLSQKTTLSECIYPLVFCASDVYTIGQCAGNLSAQMITKRRVDPSLLRFLASRGHRWSNKPGRY
jgi:hypothetical protein